MNTMIEQDDNIWDSREPAMQEVLNAARIVAATEVTTLLLGESGSGKEQLARAIHAYSPRRQAAFVTVNCGALPPTLAESLLFGQGSSTPMSTTGSHQGYLNAAAGGTLFLDNVGALGTAVQSALLHFLDSGEIIAAGGAQPLQADVRVIAASHNDLASAVAKSRFNSGLYYRLQVVPLTLPPLRERARDIVVLAERFLDGFAAQRGVAPVKLGNDARRAMTGYPWPGNVRELRNLCERLTLLLPGKTIRVENLPVEFRAATATRHHIVALPSSGLDLTELEKDLIAQALEHTGGNRSRAARLLGLTRDTLLYRLKKFSLA